MCLKNNGTSLKTKGPAEWRAPPRARSRAGVLRWRWFPVSAGELCLCFCGWKKQKRPWTSRVFTGTAVDSFPGRRDGTVKKAAARIYTSPAWMCAAFQHSHSDVSWTGAKLNSSRACSCSVSNCQCGNAHYNCLFNYFSWTPPHLHFSKWTPETEAQLKPHRAAERESDKYLFRAQGNKRRVTVRRLAGSNFLFICLVIWPLSWQGSWAYYRLCPAL